MVPVYLNTKAYLPTSKSISMFAGLDLNYSIGVGEFSDAGGFLITPSLGVCFGVTQNFAINVSVGYTHPQMEESSLLNGQVNNALTFRVGFQF